MGLLLLSTTFLSFLVIGITFAAEVPAGSDCPASSSSDTCATITVCDKVHGKCLLLAEQTCTPGTENKCVSGASCKTNACTCGAAYAVQTDKTCKPSTEGTVGFVCTSGGSECTTPNSECSSLLACKCKTGFEPNIETGKCDGIVGTTCTAADTCVASSNCDKVIGKCLLKAEQTCTPGTENKCVSGAFCDTNACKCGAGYAIQTDKTCKPNTGGTVGFACTSSGNECTTPNSECSSLGACKCKTGFEANIETGKCDGIVGTTCTAADTCVASSNCDKVIGKCLLKAEQTCTSGTENNCVSGASCVSGVCTCGAAYAKQADKTCKPNTGGTVGFGCTSGGSECTTPNSECSSLGACKCKTGFEPNIETGKCDGIVGTTCTAADTCVASSNCDKVIGKCLLKAEQTCTSGTENNCVSGASCVSGVCTCGAAYAKQADKTCKPNTGGTVGFGCTSGGSECTTPNSECSSLGACKCKTGFEPNFEDGKCVSAIKNRGNDAQSLSFWLFLLALMSLLLADCAV